MSGLDYVVAVFLLIILAAITFAGVALFRLFRNAMSEGQEKPKQSTKTSNSTIVQSVKTNWRWIVGSVVTLGVLMFVLLQPKDEIMITVAAVMSLAVFGVGLKWIWGKESKGAKFFTVTLITIGVIYFTVFVLMGGDWMDNPTGERAYAAVADPEYGVQQGDPLFMQVKDRSGYWVRAKKRNGEFWRPWECRQQREVIIDGEIRMMPYPHRDPMTGKIYPYKDVSIAKCMSEYDRVTPLIPWEPDNAIALPTFRDYLPSYRELETGESSNKSEVKSASGTLDKVWGWIASDSPEADGVPCTGEAAQKYYGCQEVTLEAGSIHTGDMVGGKCVMHEPMEPTKDPALNWAYDKQKWRIRALEDAKIYVFWINEGEVHIPHPSTGRKPKLC